MNDKELIEEIGVLIPMEIGDFNQTYIDEILAREIISLVRKADYKAVRTALDDMVIVEEMDENYDDYERGYNGAVDHFEDVIDNVLGGK